MSRATAVVALALAVCALTHCARAGGLGQDDAYADGGGGGGDEAARGPRRGRTFGLLGNALFGEGLLGGGGGGGLFGGRPGLFSGLPGILEGLFGGGAGDGVRAPAVVLLGPGWLPPFRRPYRPSPAVPFYPRPYAYQGYLDDDGYYYYRGHHENDHLVPEFH